MAAKPFIVTPRIEEILHTVQYYRYMTAQDITKLLFSGGSLTHVRDILKVLCGGADAVDNQYLFRFPLPQFTTGKTEKVFTLGSRGRDYLVNEGTPVNWYFKPSHTKHLSHGLIVHNLTLTRFLVCANIFSRTSNFTISKLRTCYELGKGEVIPDAWILFKKGNTHYPVLLEIDRGTAYQQRFKEHIKSRIEFIRSGEYQKMFDSRGCVIAYMTTGELPEYKQSRCNTMRLWSMETLKEMSLKSWASIFLFSSVVRKDMYESPLFDGLVWMRPDSDSPLGLLTD